MTLGEAVEIVLRIRDRAELTQWERDALAAVLNQLDQSRYGERV